MSEPYDEIMQLSQELADARAELAERDRQLTEANERAAQYLDQKQVYEVRAENRIAALEKELEQARAQRDELKYRLQTWTDLRDEERVRLNAEGEAAGSAAALRKPDAMRIGQSLFNFLEWLHVSEGFGGTSLRLADTFYVSDEVLLAYYEKWLDKIRQPAPSTPQEDSNHVEGIDPFYTSR